MISELKWFAIDLDQTLMHSSSNFEFGEPILENIAKLQAVVDEGYKVIIHTARHWSDYKDIETWLDKHAIPYKTIVCGKLLAYRYVDDRAINSNEKSWV